MNRAETWPGGAPQGLTARSQAVSGEQANYSTITLPFTSTVAASGPEAAAITASGQLSPHVGYKLSLLTNYVALVKAIDAIDSVYVDTSDGFTIYTIYRDQLRDVEDALYDAESEARRQVLGTGVRFRLIPRAHDMRAQLPSSAHPAYVRG